MSRKKELKHWCNVCENNFGERHRHPKEYPSTNTVTQQGETKHV